MSEDTAPAASLLGLGTWTRQGPATLVVREDRWVVLVPGLRKQVTEAAWEVLGRRPAAEEFVDQLVEAGELGSDDKLTALLFGVHDGDSATLGVKGSTPLAVYTADGAQQLVGTEEQPLVVTSFEGVRRVAFGDLPPDEPIGAPRVVSGIVPVRGFVHMTVDPAQLGEAERAALVEQVEKDGRSIETEEARKRRAERPTPTPASTSTSSSTSSSSGTSTSSSSIRRPALATRKSGEMPPSLARGGSRSSSSSGPAATEEAPSGPNLFAGLFGDSTPGPSTPPAVTEAPAPTEAPAATTPPSVPSATPAPAAGTAVPVAGTATPAAETEKLAAGTETPAAGTAAPAAGTPAPAAEQPGVAAQHQDETGSTPATETPAPQPPVASAGAEGSPATAPAEPHLAPAQPGNATGAPSSVSPSTGTGADRPAPAKRRLVSTSLFDRKRAASATDAASVEKQTGVPAATTPESAAPGSSHSAPSASAPAAPLAADSTTAAPGATTPTASAPAAPAPAAPAPAAPVAPPSSSTPAASPTRLASPSVPTPEPPTEEELESPPTLVAPIDDGEGPEEALEEPAPVRRAPSPPASPRAAAPAGDLENTGAYDDLFGKTVFRRIEDAAVRRTGEEEDEAEHAATSSSGGTGTTSAADGSGTGEDLPSETRAPSAASADEPEEAPVPEHTAGHGDFIDWVPGVGRTAPEIAQAAARRAARPKIEPPAYPQVHMAERPPAPNTGSRPAPTRPEAPYEASPGARGGAAQAGAHAQQTPYGPQTPRAQQTAPGQHTPHGQHSPHGQQAPYGQQDPFGQQGPHGGYGPESPYARPEPQGRPAPGATFGARSQPGPPQPGGYVGQQIGNPAPLGGRGAHGPGPADPSAARPPAGQSHQPHPTGPGAGRHASAPHPVAPGAAHQDDLPRSAQGTGASAPSRPPARSTAGAAVALPGLVCANGHANPPDRSACRHCRAPLGGPTRTVARPPLGAVAVSTGEGFVLDRSAIIGRRPRASRVSGTDLPQLITVPSPQQDISRSHLELRLEGWHVVALDLGTTNGTTLHREGHEPLRLRPREGVVLHDRDLLDLGDEVQLTYGEKA